MDFRLDAHDDTQRDVSWNVMNPYKIKVGVIFVDTTMTYFDIEGKDDEDDDLRHREGRRSRTMLGMAQQHGRRQHLT